MSGSGSLAIAVAGIIRAGIIRAGIIRAGIIRAGIIRAGIIRAGSGAISAAGAEAAPGRMPENLGAPYSDGFINFRILSEHRRWR